MRLLLVMTVALLATGCEIAEKAREFSADAAARILVVECQLSIAARERNRDAVTAQLKTGGHEFQAVAQDCVAPFDGKPDF